MEDINRRLGGTTRNRKPCSKEEIMTQKKIYWAPGREWQIVDGELEIAPYVFHGQMAELFPKFYFQLCKGSKLEEIEKAFPEYSKIKLKKFVHKLYSLGILTDQVQTTTEVFALQEKLFQSEQEYSKDYFLDKDCLAQFVEQQLSREMWSQGQEIELTHSELPETWSKRRSTRKFRMDINVSFEQFSSIFNALKQRRENEHRSYYYPSAGGLYPIDCYVYVKENRVEQVERGLYYYNPVKHTLNRISNGNTFQREMHYFLNKDIFETSAFSVYLFYNAAVTMPKYGAKGYYYGLLDAGIMVGLLNEEAVRNGMGICSIGDMRFEEIEEEFQLNTYQKYLHCVEFGLK